MNVPLSVKTFSAVYTKSAGGTEAPSVVGHTLSHQMDLYMYEHDVMPVTMDCEFTESNRVGNMVDFLHIATVVFMPRADWEAQQARIMASAMALRDVERPDVKDLAKKP